MIEVTQKTIDSLSSVRKTNLDAEIAIELAEVLGLGVSDALKVYYESCIARMIDANEYGLSYLDAKYLAEEVLKELQGR